MKDNNKMLHGGKLKRDSYRANCFSLPLLILMENTVVVMNKSDKEIAYYLWLDGQAVEVNGLPHSIQTPVF